jgi:hypothetical protein
MVVNRGLECVFLVGGAHGVLDSMRKRDCNIKAGVNSIFAIETALTIVRLWCATGYQRWGRH